MLRITPTDDSAADLTLKVEGRIVAGSVDALERECQRRLRGGRRIRLDLSGVTYVDSDGAYALRRMIAGDVELVNHSALILDTLQEGWAQ